MRTKRLKTSDLHARRYADDAAYRNPLCPKTGAPMQRGVRPMTHEYKDASTTFDMPGWYCEKSNESIHTGEDMKVSDRALYRLKASMGGLHSPEEIKRIRTKNRRASIMCGISHSTNAR